MSPRPAGEILVDEPSHLNLLSFRSGAPVRFDKHTYASSEDDALIPSCDAFNQVLHKAVELEQSRDAELESSASEAESSDREDATRGQAKLVSSGSEDADHENTQESISTYPSIAIAKAGKQWWPARVTKHVTEDNADADEREYIGKYRITWFDWSTDWVKETDILTTRDKRFFSVQVSYSPTVLSVRL